MTNQQAKNILLLYRPGTPDEADPEIAEALDVARQEPELARWLEGQSAVLSAVRSGLRRIPVPEGLREQIVSEVRAQVRATQRARRTFGIAISALATCLLALVLYLRPQASKENSFTTYLARMVKTAQRGYNMDIQTSNLGIIRTYFTQKSAPDDYVLPPGLGGVQAIGAKSLTFNGKPVSMVCFTNNSMPLWLFVIADSAVQDGPTGRRFQEVNSLMTVSWRGGGRTYVLAAETDEAGLKKYLF